MQQTYTKGMEDTKPPFLNTPKLNDFNYAEILKEGEEVVFPNKLQMMQILGFSHSELSKIKPVYIYMRYSKQMSNTEIGRQSGQQDFKSIIGQYVEIMEHCRLAKI